MRFSTDIFLSLLASTVSAQEGFDLAKLSNEGKVILAAIERDKSVPSDSMSFRIRHLPKDYSLTLLREKHTIDELSELTNHFNSIVRCYSAAVHTGIGEHDPGIGSFV